MRLSFPLKIGIAFAVLIAAGLLFTFERLPVDAVQRGFRGVGLGLVYNPRLVAASIPLNTPPAPQPPQDPVGQKSSEVYQNVQVLGDIDAGEFLRLMNAITEWVSPVQGCTYCHEEANLASDSVYTKVVSRRMIQMTQHINTAWKTHVASSGPDGANGVTCYTCHRGLNVPANIWFEDPNAGRTAGMAETKQGQNSPSRVTALASLPNDVFTPFLDQAKEIRVISDTALPSGNRRSIKQTEWTYGLMMHFSQSLGVNCTYCHNSRAFYGWDQSPPQRVSAWYGIRMMRDLNVSYLEPLRPVYPPHRLGPLGDAPKANCTTCHQGAYKPLFGANMIKDYPDLARVTTPPARRQAEAPVQPSTVSR